MQISKFSSVKEAHLTAYSTICKAGKQTLSYAYAHHAHTCTGMHTHTHTHTHACTCTHTCAHARTHTHTHTEYYWTEDSMIILYTQKYTHLFLNGIKSTGCPTWKCRYTFGKFNVRGSTCLCTITHTHTHTHTRT